MNWTTFANLIPVIVRLEPVIAKYGPAAIALYKADEAQALQLVQDVMATIGSTNPFSYINLLTKWGPVLSKFVATEGPVVQQFIADVKAAIGNEGATGVIVAQSPTTSGVVFP